MRNRYVYQIQTIYQNIIKISSRLVLDCQLWDSVWTVFMEKKKNKTILTIYVQGHA